MYRFRSASSLLACVLLLLLFAACGGSNNSGNNGNGQPAPALTFSVMPKVAAGGQTVNFSWATTNATSFTVTPSILGTQNALPLNATSYSFSAPASTTTYAATATGATSPPATASAVITVVPVMLAANNATISAGQSVTLTYSGPDNGSTYTLIALPGNTTTTLTGATCDGTKCTGTYTTVALTASTTFQVSATGPAGGTSSSSQVAITVNTPPTLSFTLAPTIAAPGQVVDFSWATTNATAFTVTPSILGEDQTALPLTATNYPVGAPSGVHDLRWHSNRRNRSACDRQCPIDHRSCHAVCGQDHDPGRRLGHSDLLRAEQWKHIYSDDASCGYSHHVDGSDLQWEYVLGHLPLRNAQQQHQLPGDRRWSCRWNVVFSASRDHGRRPNDGDLDGESHRGQ